MFNKIFSFYGKRDEINLIELKKKIFTFYKTTTIYDDYKTVNYKPDLWSHIIETIESDFSDKNISILEFGVGKSSFPNFVNEVLKKNIRFDAQDIIVNNKEYLQKLYDNVFLAELTTLNNEFKYDIIFSTFVWEHLNNPEDVLKHLFEILKPDGSIFIFCPRYDYPFYVSPSAKHYGKSKFVVISIFVTYMRLLAILTKKPNFLIHLDPSIFHMEWKRDYDAIHWASYWDIKYSVPKEYEVEKIKIRTDSNSFSYKFWAKYLLLAVKIKKKNNL
jgi:SAM-dependent methyltransferase